MIGNKMIEIKRLSKEHHQQFKLINAKIRKALVNQKWFMPFSEENINNMFNEGSTLVVFGAFIDGDLGAVSLFDANNDEFAEMAKTVGYCEKIGAELGGSMVLPEYRGKNLMLEINYALINEARKMGIEYFIATAHPDNVASNNSLKKLGMTYKTTLIRDGGYERNVYILDL
ncbi:MAG: GNAT family N-acetyltransferase [Clostridiales bacterium]|nr:GNAT family N-acetyltransferase [Clostridiales bacterium]